MSGTKNQKNASKSAPRSARGGSGAPPTDRAAAREAARVSNVGASEGKAVASPTEMPRLQKRYLEEVRAKLREEFGYTNPMQVPKLEKIVINMGVGEAAGDQKKLDAAVGELTALSGQKPVKTLA